MARVFLALGANLGDRRANLRHALALLAEKVRVGEQSALYDTAPVGDTDQPRFLNLVCEGETELTPTALLAFVKAVERRVGRLPSRRWGPRAIDIDILLYDDTLIVLPELTIPHPRMYERVFVLAPLAELAPDLVVPATGVTVTALLAALPDQGVRRLESEEGRL